MLQAPIERGLYLAVRVLTLAAILFFLHRLLAPIGAAPFISVFDATPTDWPYLNYTIWILGPLATGELLWWIYMKVRGALASIVLWARGLLLAAWVAVAVAIALGVRLPGDGPAELKDFIGYATGFVISILAWKLHTTVHRGLVQMWRYTKGTETAWKIADVEAAPEPLDSKARSANA